MNHRITLVHWRPDEAGAGIELLSRAGHEVTLVRPTGGNLAPLRKSLPDVFVIDLSRLPSAGRAVGVVLMTGKATRHVPLVFAGGDPAKVAKIREALPQAHCARWEDLPKLIASPGKLKAALLPLDKRGMAGYSGTPVAKKLGIAEGCVLTVLGAPEEYPERLHLPENVTIHRTPGTPSHRVLLFAERFDDLVAQFRGAARSVSAERGSGLWLIWPKRASGVDTDLNGNLVRAFALEHDWVDYKVCAVDQVWSGLLFSKKK